LVAAMMRKSTAMDALLGDFRGEILEVHFERFTREPGKAVADIARFLQTTPEPTRALWQQPESWNTHSAVHQSAAGRLRALLGESPARSATSP